MSIVLVIIGLIIGGILKGQEIIESARQKNLISQFDALRAAVNTFTDRYGSIPGDYLLATTRVSGSAQIIVGDGNGIVGPAQATAATVGSVAGNTASTENLQFFTHLAAANLLEGTAVLNLGAQFGTNSALPAVSIAGAGMTVAYGLYNHATDARSSTWVRVHKNPTTPAAALSPAMAYAIDTKIDDGIAPMGSFRTNLAVAGCGTLADVVQNYTFTVNDQLCTAIVDILP
jgi:hypothetical protein